MAETKEIKLINPPTILTVLPIVMTVASVIYFRKQGKSWMDTIFISGAVAVISSAPSWVWAFQINKQFKLQAEQKKVETSESKSTETK